MPESHDNYIKHREIQFCELNPDPNQAQSAMLLLSDVEGVHFLDVAAPSRLRISYDIRHISLKFIEEALTEVGFHLSSNLLSKLKRALHYYCEETQRANLCCAGTDGKNREMYINRYERASHGCRDQRPPHWRKYL